MSDPTKKTPWTVKHNVDREPPDWGVYDSTGKLITWFVYGPIFSRTSEQAESLARMVAAGSVAAGLYAALKPFGSKTELPALSDWDNAERFLAAAAPLVEGA